MENHKHCIFCGDVIDFTKVQHCQSLLNTLESNTGGYKPHAYIIANAVPEGAVTNVGFPASEGLNPPGPRYL